LISHPTSHAERTTCFWIGGVYGSVAIPLSRDLQVASNSNILLLSPKDSGRSLLRRGLLLTFGSKVFSEFTGDSENFFISAIEGVGVLFEAI
jgi:hypothetical protein